MTKAETIEMLKYLIDDILKRMMFEDYTLEMREEDSPEGENFVFNVVTREADLLIGQHGLNLNALQHLLRAIARRKTEDRLRFSIDINNYRKERMESLSSLAGNMAAQAVAEKRAVIMRPMTAYERRVVHITLAGNEQVKTESMGEGEERKIVIKPVGNIEDDKEFQFNSEK